MFRLSCLFYHFIPGRSGYEINESLPVPYLEMVYVLFYPAHLVLYHIGIYFDGTFGDSFIYPGGLHGHNVSNWLISQIGIPGLGLLLFIAALLFFIYLSNETILVIRKALRPSFRRKKKRIKQFLQLKKIRLKKLPGRKNPGKNSLIPVLLS